MIFSLDVIYDDDGASFGAMNSAMYGTQHCFEVWNVEAETLEEAKQKVKVFFEKGSDVTTLREVKIHTPRVL